MKKNSLEYSLLQPRSVRKSTPFHFTMKLYRRLSIPSYFIFFFGENKTRLRETWKRHPFSGLINSAGLLLHTTWRLQTSMATFLLSGSINTFCGLKINVCLGSLTCRSVHPASPVLLTKNGPLEYFYFLFPINERMGDSYQPINSLRIGPESFFPVTSNHSLYLVELRSIFCDPGGNFGGNQLLDCSISLSPL